MTHNDLMHLTYGRVLITSFCRPSEQKPSVLDELAEKRNKLLEKEIAELEVEAIRLADEIKELSGQAPERIL